MPNSYPVDWAGPADLSWGDKIGGQIRQALEARRQNQLLEQERQRRAEQETYERGQEAIKNRRAEMADKWEGERHSMAVEKAKADKKIFDLGIRDRKLQEGGREGAAALDQEEERLKYLASPQHQGDYFENRPDAVPEQAPPPDLQLPEIEGVAPARTVGLIALARQNRKAKRDADVQEGLTSGRLVQGADGNVLPASVVNARENAAQRTASDKAASVDRRFIGDQAHQDRLAALNNKPAPPAKPPTGSERAALGYFQRGLSAKADAEAVEEQVANTSLAGQARLQYAPNWLQSEEGQLYRQAQRSFTEARLRKESGAAIPPAEYDNDAKTYFAQPGDTPKVIERKRARREGVLESLRTGAGRAYAEYYGEEPPKSSNAPAGGDEQETRVGPDGKTYRRVQGGWAVQ